MSIVQSRVGAVLLAVAVAGGSGAGVAAAPGVPSGTDAGSNVTRDGYCPDGEEQAFLRLINKHRAAKGKPALKLSATLGAAAEHHSRQMARRNYFSHDLLGGVSWAENIVRHGYTFNTHKAENIAAGRSTAQGAFDMWRNSPGHNGNMLSADYKAIGIGRAYKASSKYDWYWTTTFGGVADGGPAC